jgi:hypothetical protein
LGNLANKSVAGPEMRPGGIENQGKSHAKQQAGMKFGEGWIMATPRDNTPLHVPLQVTD